MRRMPASLALLGAAALAGLSCSDATGPGRPDPYEWRLIVPAATGSGLDTLSFHWPEASLPVDIWVEDALGLPAHVADGIDDWRGGFLRGEFSARVVSDSSTADIIVLAGGGLTAKAGTLLLRSAAPECDGATEVDISADHTQLRLPIRVSIQPRFTPGDPATVACLALTTAHELGHAIGIFNHSPNPEDLMYSDPAAAHPSLRDQATVDTAYVAPATLTGVRGTS